MTPVFFYYARKNGITEEFVVLDKSHENIIKPKQELSFVAEKSEKWYVNGNKNRSTNEMMSECYRLHQDIKNTKDFKNLKKADNLPQQLELIKKTK